MFRHFYNIYNNYTIVTSLFLFIALPIHAFLLLFLPDPS